MDPSLKSRNLRLVVFLFSKFLFIAKLDTKTSNYPVVKSRTGLCIGVSSQSKTDYKSGLKLARTFSDSVDNSG